MKTRVDEEEMFPCICFCSLPFPYPQQELLPYITIDTLPTLPTLP